MALLCCHLPHLTRRRRQLLQALDLPPTPTIGVTSIAIVEGIYTQLLIGMG
jgi:hypothetical protein